MSKEAKDACKGFLTKSVDQRLGCGSSGEENVRTHSFFRRLHWARLERREVQPPFIPRVRNPRLAENFDPMFTNAKTALTPADQTIIQNMNGNEFDGFSFVNPDYHS